MAKFREMRGRIQGIENTAKITQAMKMVAAAKLRRAQDSIIAARPYGRKLRELLQFLASQIESAVSPLLEEREVKRVALVVVAADRGLCGAFNSNLLKAATYLIHNRYAEYQKAGNLDIICIGKRSVDYFTKRGYNVIAAYGGIFNSLEFTTARRIMEDATDGFLKGRYDKVDVIYNEFKSVARQSVAHEQILPIPRVEKEQVGQKNVEYIFEPSRDEFLSALLPKHLNTQMWNILLESNAAMQGAQMTAMENATRNAKDLVRNLRLLYNKARQAAITTEILEIVSGAEALKGQ